MVDAYDRDNGSDAGYVFVRTHGIWRQTQMLTAAPWRYLARICWSVPRAPPATAWRMRTQRGHPLHGWLRRITVREDFLTSRPVASVLPALGQLRRRPPLAFRVEQTLQRIGHRIEPNRVFDDLPTSFVGYRGLFSGAVRLREGIVSLHQGRMRVCPSSICDARARHVAATIVSP